jgi:hypothetical protein
MSKGKRNNRRNQRRQERGGKEAPAKPPQAPPARAPSPPGAAPGGNHARMAAAPVLEHRFNDDMLISEHDQQLARNEYPEIYHVLDHPELREQFQRYDGMANKAKLGVHRIGLLAVLLAALALLGSALTPLLRQIPDVPEWVFTALVWAEVGGIVGVAIAVWGMLIARQKKAWLEARMMAEVLRLWHFQAVICRGKEIESSCDKGNAGEPAAYHAARDRQFQAFMREWSGTLDSHLTELIEIPEAGYQMLHDEPTKYAPDSPVLEKIFGAYKSMRFRHQANYATHKLQKHTSKPFDILKWPSAILQQRTQAMAAFCFLGSLVFSLVIIIGHVTGLEFAHHIGWQAGIITFLILTVAARSVQDGLAAPEELQRYNDYAGKIRYLMGRFDTSRNPAEKLELMAEMERAALEELKGFLRAHSEARFVL